VTIANDLTKVVHLRVTQFPRRQVHPGDKIDHRRKAGKKTDFRGKTLISAEDERGDTAKINEYGEALCHLV
jgi:hypothetical protein